MTVNRRAERWRPSGCYIKSTIIHEWRRYFWRTEWSNIDQESSRTEPARLQHIVDRTHTTWPLITTYLHKQTSQNYILRLRTTLKHSRRDLRHSKNQRVEGAPPLPAIDPRTCTATADCSPTPACGTPLSATGYPWQRTGWSAGAAAGTGSAAAAPTWATGSSPARQRSVPAAPPPDTASSRRPPRTSDRPTLDATRRLSL